VANLLRTAFPHLSDNQIKITVQGMFNLDQVTTSLNFFSSSSLFQINLVGQSWCHVFSSKTVWPTGLFRPIVRRPNGFRPKDVGPFWPRH
jgi:hypothetical protein